MDKRILPIKEPNMPALFSPGGLDAILQEIENKARSVTPDTSTAKGRKAIASLASRVASSKTYLDGLGKDFVSGLKAQAKEVDAVRKDARDRLDALRAEVRAPLTEWEAAEQERKGTHEHRLKIMEQATSLSAADGLAVLGDRLEEIASFPSESDGWEEYADTGLAGRNAAIEHLSAAIALREHQDAEAEELARLRAEAAARAEQDRKEAEQRARKERDERIAQEAREATEREAQAAAAARIAEAERKAQEATKSAERAAEAERQRIAEEAERQRAENAKRAKNNQHKARMNRAARDALMTSANVDESHATACIKAIAAGKIPGVTINY